MRERYVIGNLKMNLLSREEVEQYIGVLRREMQGKHFEHTKGVLCPPSIHLWRFDHLPSGWHKGAQNVFWEKEGAYTGEISPVMLKNDGVEYVIVGHSERRLYAGETDEIVAEKTRAALKHHLIPVVCVGETKEEREQGITDTVVKDQLRAVFEGMSKLQAEKVIIAYEPRWAIGSDTLPTTQEIFQVRVLIRKFLIELFGPVVEERIGVIYGGSVKAAFLGAVSWEAEMDGVLVGRESQFPYELVKMLQLLEDQEKIETDIV